MSNLQRLGMTIEAKKQENHAFLLLERNGKLYSLTPDHACYPDLWDSELIFAILQYQILFSHREIDNSLMEEFYYIYSKMVEEFHRRGLDDIRNIKFES